VLSRKICRCIGLIYVDKACLVPTTFPHSEKPEISDFVVFRESR
jgi:hypothetical protein